MQFGRRNHVAVGPALFEFVLSTFRLTFVREFIIMVLCRTSVLKANSKTAATLSWIVGALSPSTSSTIRRTRTRARNSPYCCLCHSPLDSWNPGGRTTAAVEPLAGCGLWLLFCCAALLALRQECICFVPLSGNCSCAATLLVLRLHEYHMISYRYYLLQGRTAVSCIRPRLHCCDCV